MEAGSATVTINCEIGDDIAGQFHRRFCEYIRDDLEANALYLADDQLQVLLVSLDLAGLFDAPYVSAVRNAIEAATGVPARNVILTSTHTHDAPDTAGLLPDSVKNENYLVRLKDWLVEVATEAVAAARPARFGWAQGEAHIGYNRRLCWADGSHTMHGDSTRPDFTGLEGPDDPTHTVLYAVDEDDQYVAVVHANCCHATCIGSGEYASADYPGEARRLVREALGAEVPVLYMQGASGDTAQYDMMRPRTYDAEQKLRAVGALVASETLRLISVSDPVAAPVFRHDLKDLQVEVRLPSAEELAEAQEFADMGEKAAGRREFILATAGVLRLQNEFGEAPVDILPIHVVRIGGLAIITNPCELYCQFGLDIRRRSPADVTMIAQLADGFSGYCPTIPGLLGGGYSGNAIYWTRLEPYAGYRIVESSARLLHETWRD